LPQIIFNREIFKKAKTFISEVAVSTTASVANSALVSINSTVYTIGQNFACTIQCTTGAIWFNSITTATTANSFKLLEGDSIDLQVDSALSLISDSTTAKIQGIIWEV
jgi:hypothetical protein